MTSLWRNENTNRTERYVVVEIVRRPPSRQLEFEKGGRWGVVALSKHPRAPHKPPIQCPSICKVICLCIHPKVSVGLLGTHFKGPRPFYNHETCPEQFLIIKFSIIDIIFASVVPKTAGFDHGATQIYPTHYQFNCAKNNARTTERILLLALTQAWKLYNYPCKLHRSHSYSFSYTVKLRSSTESYMMNWTKSVQVKHQFFRQLWKNCTFNWVNCTVYSKKKHQISQACKYLITYINCITCTVNE